MLWGDWLIYHSLGRLAHISLTGRLTHNPALGWLAHRQTEDTDKTCLRKLHQCGRLAHNPAKTDVLRVAYVRGDWLMDRRIAGCLRKRRLAHGQTVRINPAITRPRNYKTPQLQDPAITRQRKTPR